MTAPMTPRRLADIRSRLENPLGSVTEKDVDDLLAEVDRLRAQVAGIRDVVENHPAYLSAGEVRARVAVFLPQDSAALDSGDGS